MEAAEQAEDRHIVLHDSVRVFGQLRLKARHGEPGQVKPHLESVVGEELHRDSGQWRHVERVIDRESGRYREQITDETGKVVREIDEPLADHRGRGAARRRGE